MPIITPTIPTIGQPNASEDVDIVNTLTALLNLVNGNIDASNILNGGITPAELGDIGHADDLQPGVIGVGDGVVGAAGSMGLSVATGVLWVRDSNGLMQRMRSNGASLTVPTAHATLPRIDQVIATLTTPGAAATLSVLQGTATAGAQSGDPSAANYRTGAATLPVNSIRLADVQVGAGVTSIVAGNLTDRRQWARGLNRIVYNLGTDASGAFNSANWRIECSGEKLLVVRLNAFLTPSGSGIYGQFTTRFNNATAPTTIDLPQKNSALGPVAAYGVVHETKHVVSVAQHILLGFAYTHSAASCTWNRTISSLHAYEIPLSGPNE
jgi:hypothetical protein